MDALSDSGLGDIKKTDVKIVADIPGLIAKSVKPKVEQIEIDHELGPANSKCVHVCPVTFKPCGCGSSMMLEFKNCGDHSENIEHLQGNRGKS